MSVKTIMIVGSGRYVTLLFQHSNVLVAVLMSLMVLVHAIRVVVMKMIVCIIWRVILLPGVSNKIRKRKFDLVQVMWSVLMVSVVS